MCKESAVPGTKTAEQEDDNEQLDTESEEVQVHCRAWELHGPRSPRRQEKIERSLPTDVKSESLKLQWIEEVVQVLDRHAVRRAEWTLATW